MRTMNFLCKVLMVLFLAGSLTVNAKNLSVPEGKEVIKVRSIVTIPSVESAELANSDQSSNNKDLGFYFRSGVITVSYINRNMETTVFTLNDSEGNTLYRKLSKKNPLIHYRLGTSELPEGNYLATLKVGDETYSRAISINR